MAWNYSEKTKQLFMDAVQGRPGTHLGEIESPDGVGEHGSIACGDALRFTFRVKRHPTDPTQDVITEAKYLTFGCTSAIAASEALCAIIDRGGYTPLQALAVKNEDIVNFLGGLPDQKIHCSVMGAEALSAAVFDWARKRGVDLRQLGVDILPEETAEGRLVCKCFNLTEPYLKRKIKEMGLKSIAEVTAATKAGGACMACHHQPGGLQDLLHEIWGLGRPSVAPAPGGVAVSAAGVVQEVDILKGAPKAPAAELSPFRLMKKIEKSLDSYVRPMLQTDGGDLEIIDIKDKTVYVRLAGACSTCVGAGQTVKLLVERALKEQVDERIRVIAV
ncbi:MAG: iron-sulfur cluster assembly scaffold protein [Deltaproteobacteria bacterium]|nr:iron-sulfur cluster assembly scaffold protein [Deltaproteobacteria bacterium]